MKSIFTRIGCAVLVILTALTVSSCSMADAFKAVFENSVTVTVKGVPEDHDYEYAEISRDTVVYSPYYTPVTSRYAYGELSEGQRALYHALLENLYKVYPVQGDLDLYRLPQIILDGYILTDTEISVVFRALSDDCPYLFWLSQSFSHLWDEDLNYTAVRGYSIYPPDELERMKAELDAVLNDFFASVEDGLDAYSRETLVHDYIIDTCSYDTEAAALAGEPVGLYIPHSVYGALVNNLCVCEGYGRSFQLLMNGLGVECVGITGMAYDSAADEDESDRQLHLWNAVKLDGEWYNVDTTWDDQESVFQRREYFNVDDAAISLDHTASAKASELSDKFIRDKGTEYLNVYIPTCSSMEYNYFVYECPRLSSFDDGVIEDALYEAAADREEYFTFYVEPKSLSYDDAVEQLFKRSPQYFFKYTQSVNERLYDYEIDDSNLSYYMDRRRSAITVELNYY